MIVKSIVSGFLLLMVIFTGIQASEKKIVYLVSDNRIPFWNIMAKGIQTKAHEVGYKTEVYSANNSKQTELQNISKAILEKVDGIVLSPINSSTAVTILRFAKQAKIPVVISDIGTNDGEYVSFISSNNEDGAYKIGLILADKMKKLGWDKDGSVGIIAIPQKRANGKARTSGFMKAMEENNIKGSGLFQQVDFSYDETYEYSMKLIKNDSTLRAIWLQGSDRYKATLDAISDSEKTGEILLLCFDSEPEFLEMIPQGTLVGAAMQQPYLMGQKAVESLQNFFNGKEVAKIQKLEILAISQDNIQEKLSIIKKNVLGMTE